MRVAVIGGGIAGLSAAHELIRRGAQAVVFEAEARPGGKVGTHAEQGYLTEDGPNFIARPLDALLDAGGLRDEVIRPRPPTTRWVRMEGRVLQAPSFSLLARVGVGRALLEPLFARDAFPTLGALAERGSLIVQGLWRKKGPRGGIWTLRRGLGSLAGAAARALGERLRLGAPVARLAPSRGGWEVEGEKFDAIVLAIPARAAAEVARGFAPRFADGLRELRSAPVTIVHLGLAPDGLPRGFGMIDADGTLHAIGTLLPGSMLPGRAPAGRTLVTCICGGARHPERAALPDGELVAGLMSDLRAVWGLRQQPDYVRVVRWRDAIPQYAPGHRERVAKLRELLAGLPPIEVAGAEYDGVSVPDVARSGALAAARLAR